MLDNPSSKLGVLFGGGGAWMSQASFPPHFITLSSPPPPYFFSLFFLGGGGSSKSSLTKLALQFMFWQRVVLTLRNEIQFRASAIVLRNNIKPGIGRKRNWKGEPPFEGQSSSTMDFERKEEPYSINLMAASQVFHLQTSGQFLHLHNLYSLAPSMGFWSTWSSMYSLEAHRNQVHWSLQMPLTCRGHQPSWQIKQQNNCQRSLLSERSCYPQTI